MEQTNAPEIRVTQNYIDDAFAEFSTITSHQVLHRFGLIVSEPTDRVPIPHVLEAKVQVPVTYTNDCDIKLNGPRTLSFELRSTDTPRRPGHSPGSAYRSYPENREVVQNILAEGAYTFNTKRLLKSTSSVYIDGSMAGIEAASVTDTSSENFFLSYLAELAQKRSLTIAHAAQLITLASMETSSSVEQVDRRINITEVVKEIHQGTGMPIPPALRRATPYLTMKTENQLTSNPEKPIISTNRYTIDSYHKGRTITDWMLTLYNNFTPANPEHLVFYLAFDSNDQPLPGAIGIDVVQDRYGAGEESIRDHKASSDAEAREMALPLIRVISNIRRYEAAAIRNLAA